MQQHTMPTHSINNQPLAKPQRTQLENTVKAAREVAEKAARAALAQLAVCEAKAPDYLSNELKALRRRLRAHGRALGDAKAADDTQGMQHLVWEVAYEHWHRMLFARFLAENGLLMWEVGAAVSLDDCEALVQETDPAMNLGAKTQWELAGKLAARMLPQVFKPQSPVFKLAFAPEHQRELERLLGGLPPEVFLASDGLGWVYQFWQAKRKDEVNASQVKIGADELPAVTQLFTEPYMVDFLLHNSLGAWWHTRHPGQPCPVAMPYWRMQEDGSPAAGNFEGWPDHLTDFKLLDPSCGSGHFLVAAFLLLVPLRIADEGLSAMDAVDAVLTHNLHGLEIDPRCVEIAVFALALAAWRYPNEDGNPLGVRPGMPAPRIACCGLKVSARPQDWEALVPDSQSNAELLRQELRLLHSVFAQAPLLGSLLNPSLSIKNDLATSSFEMLQVLIEQALSTEQPRTLWRGVEDLNDDAWDLVISARGLLEAARLLDARYHLVITNVPYLARGKQSEGLRSYCASNYKSAKHDLATVFFERCVDLCSTSGSFGIVSPQNWWFLQSYAAFRRWLLDETTIDFAASLGEEAWESFGDRGPLATLWLGTRKLANPTETFSGINALSLKTIDEKKEHLKTGAVLNVSQAQQRRNPDARVAFDEGSSLPLLGEYASGLVGLQTSDDPMFIAGFWEFSHIDDVTWEYLQGTPIELTEFSGCSWLVRWEKGEGLLLSLPSARPTQGAKAIGHKGVAIHRMRVLFPYRFASQRLHQNVAVLISKDDAHLPAIWCFCSSPEYDEAVRKIDRSLKVTNATLVKVPFDLAHWQQVAAERYPDGLPKPYSDDPTQWLFHGHPQPATDPLQVAVARLVGYRWPAEQEAAAAQAAQKLQEKTASILHGESASSYQIDTTSATVTPPLQGRAMELSDTAHAWIARCAPLAEHTDDDGIVCLPSVRGEAPAHERLLKLLIAAWETAQPGSWKPATLDKLLGDADCTGKGLDVWLRDKFFEQHAKRFQHRPFVWHVWDGLKDGFAALVNYHQLDAKNMERLIHTYLGDWIRNQEAGVANGTDGAALRLSAALALKQKLEAIQQGEFDGKVGYDIFVRWKPLAEQPIGWNPDLNDGVRINIRPFMTAEVLRHNKKPKLNITWDKDRGKDVESAPWFKMFQGERINDHHLSLAEKIAAGRRTGDS